jgi:hypothetical protein
MSEESSTKTKDILIEICPECNTLHVDRLTNGIIESRGKAEIVCNTKIGMLDTEDPEHKTPTPILCTHKIKPTESNTFKIRRWTYRERQEFYRLTGTFTQTGEGQSSGVKVTSDVMDFAITTCAVKSPEPLKTKEDLDKTTLDGAILDILYTQILAWNSPPLAPFSVSRQRSTPTT